MEPSEPVGLFLVTPGRTNESAPSALWRRAPGSRRLDFRPIPFAINSLETKFGNQNVNLMCIFVSHKVSQFFVQNVRFAREKAINCPSVGGLGCTFPRLRDWPADTSRWWRPSRNWVQGKLEPAVAAPRSSLRSALLYKSADDPTAPIIGQTYPATFVTGIPSAV